jgi:hypothetical protein
MSDCTLSGTMRRALHRARLGQKRAKVFWFFFSKKNFLLSFLFNGLVFAVVT